MNSPLSPEQLEQTYGWKKFQLIRRVKPTSELGSFRSERLSG
jgi:hypothetical protein